MTAKKREDLNSKLAELKIKEETDFPELVEKKSKKSTNKWTNEKCMKNIKNADNKEKHLYYINEEIKLDDSFADLL